MKYLSNIWISLLLTSMLFMAGCGGDAGESSNIPDTPQKPAVAQSVQNDTVDKPSSENLSEKTTDSTVPEQTDGPAEKADVQDKPIEGDKASEETIPTQEETTPPASAFKIEDVPAYSGQPYTALNENVPYFDTRNLSTKSYESYSALDRLGRCGSVSACVGQDLMPTEERGAIGQVKPSGWHTVKYDFVDGRYLYNRCHLIGYQLTAENANTSNLITGTRYLNIQGMLPFENMTADYVKETGNHVEYHVTPVFEGENLLATGVLMEGYSVEDQGDGVCFCVFAYNVQPGVIIDYATGDSKLDDTAVPPPTPPAESKPAVQEPTKPENNQQTTTEPQGNTYILNTNTKKFHYPSCSSVGQMKESNKKSYTGSRDDVISQGYVPCKRCNP